MGSGLAIALATADVQALGLGGLRVQSALNQPFVGEIALLDVKPDELDAVKVQIASAEEFSKAGSERYHYLSRLRFSPQLSPRGEPVIRISSREPIREPYMDFLVEVAWPKGRLVKGYTVLLDPPATDGRRPPLIDQPVVQPRSSPQRAPDDTVPAARAPMPPQRQATSPTPAAQRAPIPTTPAKSAGDFPKHIGPVPRGTGLWRLASKNAPAGATVAQTAMALYRNNQSAFINGDINRLTTGKTLVIPSATELFALGPEAADREFAAALRGEKVRRAPITDPAPPGPESESRLKIAGAAPEAPTPGVLSAPAAEVSETLEQELLLVRESSESTRQETAELRGRIRELETQLADIQQLLRLRNAELARIQGEVASVVAAQTGQAPAVPMAHAPLPEASLPAPEEPPATAPAPLSPEVEVALAQALARSGAAEAPGGGQQPEPVVPDASVETPLPPPPGMHHAPSAEEPRPAAPDRMIATVAGDTTAGGESPLVSPPPLASEPMRPVSQIARSRTGEADPEAMPREAPGGSETGLALPWEDLLVPLAGAAGVTALGIGALAWVRGRRRRASGEVNAETELVALEAQEDVAETPPPQGQAQSDPSDSLQGLGDSGGFGAGTVTPPSVFSTLSRSHPESDEADVLSEADIYIAYGRFREAEDLLREEIQRTPGRIELKYKLAESYHDARNYPALDALMTEMQGAGEDRLDPDRWQRLVEMAKAIEGLERTDPAVKPPTARSAATAAESMDPLLLASAGALSLDIGEAKGAAADFRTLWGEDDLLGPDVEPAQRDVPVLRSSRPAPLPVDDLETLTLDLDALSRSLGPGSNPQAMEPEAHLEQDEGELLGGAVSDLELTIDDLRAASDLDLESFVDSTRTVSNLVDEPLSRNEPTIGVGGFTSGPAKLRAVTTEGTRAGGVKTVGGSLYSPDEDGSSDLLSSQWQMDSGLWDETATKLDLARAYVEMGDQDSAKGILEEVVNEGTEEQRGEAAQMLRALG